MLRVKLNIICNIAENISMTRRINTMKKYIVLIFILTINLFSDPVKYTFENTPTCKVEFKEKAISYKMSNSYYKNIFLKYSEGNNNIDYNEILYKNVEMEVKEQTDSGYFYCIAYKNHEDHWQCVDNIGKLLDEEAKERYWKIHIVDGKEAVSLNYAKGMFIKFKLPLISKYFNNDTLRLSLVMFNKKKLPICEGNNILELKLNKFYVSYNLKVILESDANIELKKAELKIINKAGFVFDYYDINQKDKVIHTYDIDNKLSLIQKNNKIGFCIKYTDLYIEKNNIQIDNLDRYCREFFTKQTDISESLDKKVVLLSSIKKISLKKNLKTKEITPKSLLGSKYNSILNLLGNKNDIILKTSNKLYKIYACISKSEYRNTIEKLLNLKIHAQPSNKKNICNR